MTVLLDAAGRRRSPATLPGYRARRPPRNKGTAAYLRRVATRCSLNPAGS